MHTTISLEPCQVKFHEIFLSGKVQMISKHINIFIAGIPVSGEITHAGDLWYSRTVLNTPIFNFFFEVAGPGYTIPFVMAHHGFTVSIAIDQLFGKIGNFYCVWFGSKQGPCPFKTTFKNQYQLILKHMA